MRDTLWLSVAMDAGKSEVMTWDGGDGGAPECPRVEHTRDNGTRLSLTRIWQENGSLYSFSN